MKKKYIIRRLLSFIFLSAVLAGVCPQTVTASSIIDPEGTYIEAENYSGSQDLASNPNTNTRFQKKTNIRNSKGGKVLKAGNSGYAANTPGNEVKEYRVYFPEADTYYMWMRGIGYNGNADSIFFTVDDDTWKAWNYGGHYDSFVWTKSMQVGSNNTITVDTAGYHTLKIAMRESNSIIDGFFITNNYYSSLNDSTVANKTEIDPSTDDSGALWTLDTTTIEASCYQAYNAADITFTITNSGVSDATSTGTATSDSTWLSVSDPVPALEVGESHTVTVTFDTTSLSAGNHTGVITFTSSGGSVLNAPLTVTISLTVQHVPTTSSCGSIPLFAENIVSPAIMVQLDTSGSMSSSMSVGNGQNKSRIAIAEDVLAQLFEDQTIEWGFATWAGGNGSSSDDGTSSNYYTNYRIGCHTHDDDHQTALQDKADDGNANGWTPLVPCMRAGLEYFQATRKDNYYKEYFTQVSCQPRILVIITDGIGNTGTNNTKIDDVMEDLIDEGITVVTVGFGLSNATQLDRIVQKMQTAGEESEDDYLYHLHEEEDGTAVPFMAQNEAEFIAAMTDIVSSVKAQMFHGASPALSTSATDGAILLNASFDATDWTGNLSATKFNAFTGVLESDYLWKAADVLPATINGFIYDSSSSGYVSKYTDASIEGDNFLCKDLGDIINSAPAIVSSVPPYYYKFDDYFTFKYNSTVYNRAAMVYIGANDGALHAFQLEDGVEKWRFYPDAVASKLANAESDPAQDMCSSSYCHQFLLDGSPELADIYVNSTTGWRTILTTGLGKGGSAFFSLDITHSEDFDAADNIKSKFLWEFTDTELGLATSDPVTARVSNGTPSTGWVTFFGSGEAESTSDQSNKEAYLFAVKSYNESSVWVDTDGNDIYKVKLSPTTLLDDKTSSPLVVDTHNDDYIYDNIYIGNLYGNLYRVSGIGFNEVPDSDILFNSGNTDHSTPISATPSYAYDSDGNLWVYFGTGQYSEQADKVSTSQQYFYGLYDKNAAINDDGSAPYTLSNLALLETDIVEAYSLDADGDRVDMDGDGDVDSDKYTYRTISCSSPDTNGDCNPSTTHSALTDEKPWAIKLYTSSSGNPSERIITQPLITSGIVFIVTFVPDGDVCEGNGDAWILAVDWETGETLSDPVFDINGDGTIDDADKTVEDDSGDKHQVVGFYLGGGRPSDTIAIYGNNIAVGGTGGLLSGEAPLSSDDDDDDDGDPGLIQVNLPDQDTTLKSWQQDLN
ncbi:hypothetical protein DO021_01410 [Desulfobacter hydrogenophilus]|uniref:VWFA domain-containing protein n=1 Tax=Desulfobacter hydrogenophilus TaxID=2291 RepID=A0A328FJR7_9BACT|nr:PilC/PilY family type IV pilus protein [Desulfobacter hydrogenophilus]NDY71793.1 hypothetical protein [Desulfobacter hydrogenophilus]QBH13491.1 hypothetical protein EYB58_11480 [Desulfobacter hydrogenophilus]RAM03742.1 hypothetical protein DO021_01410 [Desulfobacter hydrogenophilus]